ncbi:MAG TPA: cyclopropane-fatty-acyl-phospholipid synthase family protein [Oligoflexus sp.]|uniref:cyclopropane-fatty-acyl-phospholipid synthase family protein n=1 Tax=Oligoflexus sp. TaxID=1971216 RepID=UPI002D54DB47|nr:cyclopropane-fatty-acyl-phospholipid synthase family protein [Oligoflexus sp.]HYX32392.1 cyclopropane-fatty-acyl-phospholipid synthase family protein [Oligoflexus sp.]
MYTKIISDTLRKASEQSPSLFAALVARHFSKMPKGRMVVEDIQNGRTYHWGQSSEVSARITVNDPVFFRKLVLATDIGLGESYVDGDWDTDDIGKVIRWFILNLYDMPSMSGGRSNIRNLLVNAMAAVNKIHHSLNQNSIDGSRKNISNHYDLGNEFFSSFLDETMTYSSALYASEAPEPMAVAQRRKLQSMAEMAGVKPHHKILEIGTGWGEFSCYLAETYGCEVTSLTISEQQFAYARQKVRKRGLEHLITIKNMDYRKFYGQFDRIFTVEMLEAVGAEFLPTFFEKCDGWLKPSGKMVHQVILSPDARFEDFKNGVDWIQKHIFPGSLLPSMSALLEASNQDDVSFIQSDYKDMGLDYARTLREWQHNFNRNFPGIAKLGFDEAFRRKWNYYFAYCEAAFSMRNITVAQIGMTRPNNHQPD